MIILSKLNQQDSYFGNAHLGEINFQIKLFGFIFPFN